MPAGTRGRGVASPLQVVALRPLIRIPVRFRFDLIIEVDVLDVPKIVQPFDTQFTVHSAHSHPAEGCCIIVRQWIIDPLSACTDVLHRIHGVLHIIRVDAGAEPKIGVIREPNGLITGNVCLESLSVNSPPTQCLLSIFIILFVSN